MTDSIEGGGVTDSTDRAAERTWALARRIHAFCPDFVDQGLGLTETGTPEQLIVRHFARDRSFFFWWD